MLCAGVAFVRWRCKDVGWYKFFSCEEGVAGVGVLLVSLFLTYLLLLTLFTTLFFSIVFHLGLESLQCSILDKILFLW